MHVGYEAAFLHRDKYPDELFIRRELEYCLRAEALGFDSVWLTEHHFSSYGLVPDPLQALSYIAAKTTRIKLGTAVLVLPWHDPLRLAEQVILADHLSDGRLVIGIGRGLAKDEFEGLRVPMEQSRARFTEHAELLLQGLDTGVIEGGLLTQQPRRELRPRPFKSFKGRVFSASVSPESGPLVAQLGLGMMFIIVKPADLMGKDIARHRATWSDMHGSTSRPPQPLLSAVVVVDQSEDRALELAKKYNRENHRVAVKHYDMANPEFGTTKGYEFYRNLKVSPGPDLDLPPSTVIYGTPDQVLKRFEDYKNVLNMQGVLTIFHGMPDEDGERSLRCFVQHCLPELKSWPTEATF
ncbi:LLM class flavin-dependent oxidoreductase [Streptomyces sp. NPDC059970]|uniref:LLM class flavin-dependent oxidoreductase n=1 Tax=Streptomyces sp. NPDC059970 TaxID=3347019 RepID=UPI0036CC9592